MISNIQHIWQHWLRLSTFNTNTCGRENFRQSVFAMKMKPCTRLVLNILNEYRFSKAVFSQKFNVSRLIFKKMNNLISLYKCLLKSPCFQFYCIINAKKHGDVCYMNCDLATEQRIYCL